MLVVGEHKVQIIVKQIIKTIEQQILPLATIIDKINHLGQIILLVLPTTLVLVLVLGANNNLSIDLFFYKIKSKNSSRKSKTQFNI